MKKRFIKSAVLLICMLCQSLGGFTQAKYWGFNYSNTLDFSSGTAVATTPANVLVGPDLLSDAAHTIYDNTGNILFSVTAGGVYDRTGTWISALLQGPRSEMGGEIEVFPNGEACGHYYVIISDKNDLHYTYQAPLFFYDVDASNPASISVTLKDVFEGIGDAGNHTMPYTFNSTHGPVGMVATRLDANNARKLYVLTVAGDKPLTPPFNPLINWRLVMKCWEFKADGSYIQLPEVLLNYDGIPPHTHYGEGDKMGRLPIMEATPDGSKVAYAGPFGLRVYHTATGTITNYPIPAIAAEYNNSHAMITGIEYVPNGPQAGRWYVSYTYLPTGATKVVGTIGYFEDGVTTVLHSAGGVLLPTFGGSDLELGRDGRLYFASCPTCPLPTSPGGPGIYDLFYIGHNYPTTAPSVVGPYANPGTLYSFDPFAAVPTYSVVPGVTVKQSVYVGGYYYLNNQIDGEDMSTWDPSAPSQVASVDIYNGLSAPYPSTGCSFGSMYGTLQLLDVNNLILNFKDALGAPVKLSVHQEYSISWTELDPCGMTPIAGSTLNYLDGWHPGSGPIDLKTYGSGTFSSSASFYKYFGFTIKIHNKCSEAEEVYYAFVRIDNQEAGCNSNFTLKSTMHISPMHPVSGTAYLIPDKSVHVDLDNYHATSTYTIDYGDGTGIHPYLGYPYFYTYSAPGTYNVCVTERTSTGTECTTCYSFCVGLSLAMYYPAEIRADTCNADFTAKLILLTGPYSTSSILGIPNRSIQLDLDNYNPTSTYTVDYGDGTGAHPFIGSPFYYTYASPGTYNVCITEEKPREVPDMEPKKCTICYSFCIGASLAITPQRKSESTIISRVEENKILISPNPTRADADLSIALTEKSNVKIAVIDMTGKRVADVFNGSLEEGVQKLNINTDNFASGLYQVQVMIGNKMSTHKLSVIK